MNGTEKFWGEMEKLQIQERRYLYLKVLIREKVLEFRVQGRRTNIAQRHTSFFQCMFLNFGSDMCIAYSKT